MGDSSSSSEGDAHLIVVVGNSSVGKTTLILKFFDKAFNVDDGRDQTLNVDYKTVERIYNGTTVKMQVVCPPTHNKQQKKRKHLILLP
jgi:GTPase SAR1 family protein